MMTGLKDCYFFARPLLTNAFIYLAIISPLKSLEVNLFGMRDWVSHGRLSLGYPIQQFDIMIKYFLVCTT